MKASAILLCTLVVTVFAFEDKESITTAFTEEGFFFLRFLKPVRQVLTYKVSRTEQSSDHKHTIDYRLKLYPNPFLSDSNTNAYLGWFEGYYEVEDKKVKEFKNFAQKEQLVFMLYEKVVTGQIESVKVSKKLEQPLTDILLTAINGIFPQVGNPKEYFIRRTETKGTLIENIRGIVLDQDRIMSEKILLNEKAIVTNHTISITTTTKPKDNPKKVGMKTVKTEVELLNTEKADILEVKEHQLIVQDSYLRPLQEVFPSSKDKKNNLTRGQ